MNEGIRHCGFRTDGEEWGQPLTDAEKAYADWLIRGHPPGVVTIDYDGPKVGDWCYICCEEDLGQITDEEMLRECLAWDAEEDEDASLRHKYFATEADALASLQTP